MPACVKSHGQTITISVFDKKTGKLKVTTYCTRCGAVTAVSWV